MTTSKTRAEVTIELALLRRVERALMRRWAELHAQTARLYRAAPLNSRDTELLEQHESSKRALSGELRKLHDELDELGARLGPSRRREYVELEHVA